MNGLRPSLRTGLTMLAGGTALGYAAGRRLLGTSPGADRDFFQRHGTTSDHLELPHGERVDLPALYYDDDAFMGIFSAAYDPVRELLPSDDLYPATLPGGRAAVAVFAFDYKDVSFDFPYGEIAIAALCTFGRPAPMGLPVTARVPRDAGRVGWGLAKFVADMDFTRRPDYQSVHLAEGGAHILTLTVRQRGVTLRDNRPITILSVLDGQLVETVVPTRAVYQLGIGSWAGDLALGDHQLADQLRALDLSAAPLVAKNYLLHYGVLPRGQTLGPADRPYDGYLGVDREYGRLTVSYDARNEPLDVYARRRAAAGVR